MFCGLKKLWYFFIAYFRLFECVQIKKAPSDRCASPHVHSGLPCTNLNQIRRTGGTGGFNLISKFYFSVWSQSLLILSCRRSRTTAKRTMHTCSHLFIYLHMCENAFKNITLLQNKDLAVPAIMHFLRFFCVYTNKKHIMGPSVRSSFRPVVCMFVFVYHWTVLDQIWSGSLWL